MPMTTAKALRSAEQEPIDVPPMEDLGGGYPVGFLWVVVAGVLAIAFRTVPVGLWRWAVGGVSAGVLVRRLLLAQAATTAAFVVVGFPMAFSTMPWGAEAWRLTFAFFQWAMQMSVILVVTVAVVDRPVRRWLPPLVAWGALVQPLVTRWTWSGLLVDGGWLEAPDGGALAGLGLPGVVDFAGSLTLWLPGGLALVVLLRWLPTSQLPMARPAPWFRRLDTFILVAVWFWSGGSQWPSAPEGAAGRAVVFIAVNVNLAVLGALVAGVVTARVLRRHPTNQVFALLVAGTAAISGPCANIMAWAALVVGAVVGPTVVLVERAWTTGDTPRMDRSLALAATIGGGAGTLAAAVFNVEGFSVARLGTQLLALVVVTGWVVGAMSVVLGLLRRVVG